MGLTGGRYGVRGDCGSRGRALSSGWEHHYRAAIYAPDPEKVATLAQRAEQAIKNRMPELVTVVGSSAMQEMGRLSEALQLVHDLMHR
jgi:hypothetical protein